MIHGLCVHEKEYWWWQNLFQSLKPKHIFLEVTNFSIDLWRWDSDGRNASLMPWIFGEIHFCCEIVFIDKSWVVSNLTFSKCWKSSDKFGYVCKFKFGETSLIILRAGTINGFFTYTQFVYKASCIRRDYHGSMNHTNFQKWVVIVCQACHRTRLYYVFTWNILLLAIVNMLPSKLTQLVTLLTCIWEIPSSDVL
jgi:hypothetical protein